ncbi:hypothetical protein GOP47_0022172 [Adiantum capillus-veneris]|uniref:Uncharacterized protein n=1 Tax=Adiantum capillus-veneris TaxID=13818 RepID=A0A9D4Z728_ADICA|nr:hypothetical protein GOP47_0021554 [Adiantum capillus-veneris]KAI5063625.1 hypothetical protein GOP47_0022172 [Adiantum capillus-veneris]
MSMASVSFSSSTYYPQRPSAAAQSRARHSLLQKTSIAGDSLSSRKRPASSAGVYAQLLPFKARRQVDLPFQSGSSAPEIYVKEVERIVKVTFPDSARISFLGDSTWRATLKPVSFFSLSATPACDIRVFHENSSLKISSDKLVLDFKGVPVQFEHLDFDFSLLGELYVVEHGSLRRQQNKSFQGWVDLRLKVDMPLPFSMMPDVVLTPVGNGILDRILGAMESALLAGLLRDYKQWCRKQSEQSSSPLSPEAATYQNFVSS